MITLTELNTSRGAPMGRFERHHVVTDDLTLHLERVPIIDGGYDVGGAYWGTGEYLWHYCTAPEDPENTVYGFVRSVSREKAKEEIYDSVGYLNYNFLPETGSIIKQTITWLQDWLLKADSDEDPNNIADAEETIADLQDELQQIRHPDSFYGAQT
jgi:hypothetical protein